VCLDGEPFHVRHLARQHGYVIGPGRPMICNLVDQETAAGGTASIAQFCAAAIQSRACLLRVKKRRSG
jgi:hypothetical protein